MLNQRVLVVGEGQAEKVASNVHLERPHKSTISVEPVPVVKMFYGLLLITAENAGPNEPW